MTAKFFVPRADRRLGDRYLLLDCLGDGSYGWVWKAQRVVDGAIVAVKIPKAQSKRTNRAPAATFWVLEIGGCGYGILDFLPPCWPCTLARVSIRASRKRAGCWRCWAPVSSIFWLRGRIRPFRCTACEGEPKVRVRSRRGSNADGGEFKKIQRRGPVCGRKQAVSVSSDEGGERIILIIRAPKPKKNPRVGK